MSPITGENLPTESRSQILRAMIAHRPPITGENRPVGGRRQNRADPGAIWWVSRKSHKGYGAGRWVSRKSHKGLCSYRDGAA